ncbi:MAG: hypothetical protein HOV97_34890 [Nonomuraea sp.]|nr:hypothetical protein [Nonomuraea sp.]
MPRQIRSRAAAQRTRVAGWCRGDASDDGLVAEQAVHGVDGGPAWMAGDFALPGSALAGAGISVPPLRPDQSVLVHVVATGQR